MVIEQQKDKYGNIIYEKHDSGYWEINEYYEGKLIRTESHYTNGRIEVEKYNIKCKELI